MRRAKPARSWVVHAVDPKRTVDVVGVVEPLKYPLCGERDRGYGSLFAVGPRFVTCRKCKALLRAWVLRGKDAP